MLQPHADLPSKSDSHTPTLSTLVDSHLRVTPDQKALERAIAEVEGCSAAQVYRDFLVERAQFLGIAPLKHGETWVTVGGCSQPQLVQVDEVPQLVQVNKIPQLVQVDEVPQLVQVDEVPQLVQVNKIPQLVQVVELVTIANELDRNEVCAKQVKRVLNALEPLLTLVAWLLVRDRCLQAYKGSPAQAVEVAHQHLKAVLILTPRERLTYHHTLLW